MDGARLSQIARWLLGAFACAMLILSAMLTFEKGADILPGIAYSAFLTCWLSAPAALAVLLVASCRRLSTSWAYLFAESIVIASSILLLLPLFLVPDAQNGIALAFLPIVQGGLLLLYAAAVWLVQVLTNFLLARS